MHDRQPDGAARRRKLVPHALGKAAHREFRRGISRLSRRGDDAEDRGQIDDVRLAHRLQVWQEGARAAHYAPELMSNSQSICAWSISSNEPISATPALLTTMPSAGCAVVASFANRAMSSGSPTSTRWMLTLHVDPISAASVFNPASSRSASAR